MSGSTILSPNTTDTTIIKDGQGVAAVGLDDIRQLNDSLAGLAITQQSATTYTFAGPDRGTMVESTNSSATVFTVPLNSAVAFPVGSFIAFRQYGTGSLSIAGTAGVTLRPSTTLIVGSQYLGGTLHKRGTDEWIVTI